MGQIATFIGELGLSYNEVVREIPFRNLVLMLRDKLRACYGDKMEEVDGAQMGKQLEF